jgi:hypothetical protein
VYRLVYEAQYWHHRPRSFRLICLSKGKMRADERTRTADLISLRVRGQWLLGVAQDCNPRIDNGSFVPYMAHLLQGIACGLGSRVRGLRRGWFLFKPHSRASVCAATACSERPDTLTAEQSLSHLATGSLYKILDVDLLGGHLRLENDLFQNCFQVDHNLCPSFLT